MRNHGVQRGKSSGCSRGRCLWEFERKRSSIFLFFHDLPMFFPPVPPVCGISLTEDKIQIVNKSFCRVHLRDGEESETSSPKTLTIQLLWKKEWDWLDFWFFCSLCTSPKAPAAKVGQPRDIWSEIGASSAWTGHPHGRLRVCAVPGQQACDSGIKAREVTTVAVRQT